MNQRARGQAMIEFAGIALVFFILLFGIVDFGLLFNGWLSVSSAASVSARRAAIGDVDGIVSTVAETALVPGAPTLRVAVSDCDTTGTSCATLCAPGAWPAGPACDGTLTAGALDPQLDDMLTVLVAADYHSIFFPITAPLMSSTTVRYEGAYIP